MRGLLVRVNFALTDTLPLKNGTFLTKISIISKSESGYL